MSKKDSPEVVAKEWVVLKSSIKAAEKRLSVLKEFLEPVLAAKPEKSAEWAGWRFTLVESKGRETFDLSAAKEKLDGRILAPYVKKGDPSIQIRTSWQGGEEEDAA